jgi:hypothetical protein
MQCINISQNVKMLLHIVDLHEIMMKFYSNSGQRISSIYITRNLFPCIYRVSFITMAINSILLSCKDLE